MYGPGLSAQAVVLPPNTETDKRFLDVFKTSFKIASLPGNTTDSRPGNQNFFVLSEQKMLTLSSDGRSVRYVSK